MLGGDAVDRAVALDAAGSTPSAPIDGLGEVALLVLDDRQLARRGRRAARRPGSRSASRCADPVAELTAGAPSKTLVDEVVATDRPDRGEQARWPGRRSWSGRGPGRRGVTSYTWRGRPTPWRTAWRLTSPAASSAWSCWRTPVRLAPSRRGQLLGRARAVVAQPEQEVAPQAGRAAAASGGAARHGRPMAGGWTARAGAGARLGHRAGKASTGDRGACCRW